MITDAPALVKTRTVASPIPLAPPVTSAILPSSLNCSILPGVIWTTLTHRTGTPRTLGRCPSILPVDIEFPQIDRAGARQAAVDSWERKDLVRQRKPTCIPAGM